MAVCALPCPEKTGDRHARIHAIQVERAMDNKRAEEGRKRNSLQRHRPRFQIRARIVQQPQGV